ncbi:PQQ-binding-like beta-propeller repeat protein [Streptomyces sp. NPDC012888]|uniref:outer membrane protein assembly factor BamB family protein n=1 Tax=Streptomyces sp. NPDC012888 TaxID=3364855 RepID=UPI00367D6279
MSTPPPPPPNQPPQPPNQPPAGGFGAPQDPRAGFGAPQDPRAGFGAPTPPAAPPVPPAPPQAPPVPPAPPQAPPVPPAPPQAPGAQQPGHPGQPGQPGHPVGQPGQPGYGYPQQGYGYPQQPGYPTTPQHVFQAQNAPAGNPGARAKRNQLMIIGAAVVAIAVIIAGGVWLVAGDDGGTVEPSANGSSAAGENKPGGSGGSEKATGNVNSKVLVNVEQPKVPPAPDGGYNTIGTYGSWVTDTVYAKSDIAKVVGYNLNDGSQKWTVPLPGHVCAASKHVSDNKTAVLFQYKLPTAEEKSPTCNSVGVIDLNSGKLLWSAEAKSSTGGDRKIRLDEVTISGQTVAAGGVHGGGAWSLNDGRVLWEPKVDGQGCYDMGYGGGEALGVLRKCGRLGSQTLHAQVLDPNTGAPKYSYKMSQGIEYGQILSTKPLVVAANVNRSAPNATGVSDIFVIDEAGQLKTTISLTSGNYDPKCGYTEVERCQKIVVGNGKVYLPSIEHQGTGNAGGPRTNEIVSFDLNTGKQTTDRADAGERYTMFPLRMDGSNIIAYKRPPYDKGGQVVSIDGATMKQTVLMVNPDDKDIRRAETGFVPGSAEFRYHKGRLFIADDIISNSSNSANVEEKDYLFVSFTTH